MTRAAWLGVLALAAASLAQEPPAAQPEDPAVVEHRQLVAAQQAYESGRHAEAARLLRAVHARGGGDGASHALLAHALFQLDDREAARAEYVAALGLGRVSADVLLRLVEIDRARGDVLVALEELRLAILLRPEDAALPVAAADLAAEAGLQVEAERGYERALEADAAAADTWLRLGNLHARAGRTEEALVAFRIARALGAARVTRLIAELELAAGDYERAAETYGRLVLEEPDDPDLRLRRAELLLAAGRPGDVEEGLRDVSGARALVLVGRARSMRGDAAAALDAWDRALDAGAPAPELDALLGLHFHRAGEHGKAVEHLRRCLEAEGPDLERQLALTRSLLALGDRDGARAALVDLLEEFGFTDGVEDLVRRLAALGAATGS